MFRTIIGLALAGIALTPFAEKGAIMTEPHPVGVDPIQTSSMATGNRTAYVAATPSGQSCRIVVEGLEGGAATAHADAGCAEVYPGLESVAQWSPSDGSTVRLLTATGDALLELGASDGFAYEAVSPLAAQVTFSQTGV